MAHDRPIKNLSEVESRSETASDARGAGEATVSLIGKTVSWVRDYLGETCTIPPEAMAFVDGEYVSEDYVLKEGQVIEFALEGEDEEWAAECTDLPSSGR
jgi:hypothetical protein